ncbi:hypothetical protein [Reichenbachiella sp. MALMAid0571]|uniref:hypothetical protein n=1 Tax=Reichenbachiella sp. MALMAid0571 TaxID=3143939 RepID=UPI0032DF1DB6
MTTVRHPISLIAVFLWIGFVCAISFMEAWLKFQAPGITLSLGLGIGRLVFDALNKIEWVFVFAVFLSSLISKGQFFSAKKLFYYLPVIILIIQTTWLLPALDARAEMHIQGLEVPSSNLHFYYVALEALKVISLIIFGINQFKIIK